MCLNVCSRAMSLTRFCAKSAEKLEPHAAVAIIVLFRPAFVSHKRTAD